MVPFSWTPELVGPMEGTLSLINNATDPDPYLLPIRGVGISVGIVETPGAKPTTYSLGSNYPNPFNNTTKFAFSLPVNGNVSLKVYDIQGQEVANLADGWIGAGTYEVSFDASGLTTGVYVYSLTAGDFTASGKMVLMK